MRLRNTPAILALLLAPTLLPADVTLRYKVETIPNPTLLPAFSQALNSARALIAKDKTIRVKGGLISAAGGSFNGIVDSSHDNITILDPAHRRFVTIPFSQYADEILHAVKPATAVAQNAMAAMKITSNSRLTGRKDVIQDIQAEEHEFTMTLSGPLGPQSSSVDLVRAQIDIWMATQEEIARNPTLREFADSSVRRLDGLDSGDIFQKLLSQFPGLADGLVTHMKEATVSHSVNLRTQVQIFLPIISVLAARAPDKTTPFGAMDPKAAVLTTNEELVEISSAPIDASAFAIPDGYTAASLAEVLAGMRPTPVNPTAPVNPANPVPGGVTHPMVLQRSQPIYTEEARAKKIEGAVTLSVVVGIDGKASNIQVINSLDPGLDQSAVEAVTQWVFKPGTKSGVPVSVHAQIVVNFRLLAKPPAPPQ